jgi:hypothetical protein
MNTNENTKMNTNSNERPSISFNPSIESFDLPEEDGFTIGEDVPINTMNFSDLEPTIDLGIVEL